MEVQLQKESFAPGDTVAGTVVVHEGGRSRSLEVRLEFHEKTEDYTSVVRTISTGALHSGDLAAGMVFPFSLSVPADALPNCRGGIGELCWQVHVKSDERGRDSHVWQRVLVAVRQNPRQSSVRPGAGQLTAPSLAQPFPIRDYDALEVSEILLVLPELYDDELELVEQRERAGKQRAPILDRIDELR